MLDRLTAYLDHLNHSLLSMESMVQLAWVLLSVVGGYLLSRRPRRLLDDYTDTHDSPNWLQPFRDVVCEQFFPLITLIFLLLYSAAAAEMEWKTRINQAAISLTVAWIVIRFCSVFIRQRSLARWVAMLAWTVAALNIVGVLDNVVALLDSVAFSMGESRLSLLIVLQGVALLTLLLWGAATMARLAEHQLRQMPDMAPSLQVLITKIVRITLIVIAFLIGLNAVGIDLTAFAVFGGAIGVGIGFGLQKVVSNFISGIILLLDRSIKPGDVIVVEDTYGWVNKLSSRHVSVLTRDGKEHLIPNEFLITEKVENWSYSNNNVRIRVPLSVAYNTDLRQAIEVVLDAVKESPRIMKDPSPNCLVRGFGDSAVELELRVWIQDPANGVGNIMSELYLLIWDAFKEHHITIPFPQREVHLMSDHTKEQAA